LTGKIKITVIATGFGPPSAVRLAGSVAQTPVDMTQYAEGIRLRSDGAVPAALASGDRLALRGSSLARRMAADTPMAASAAAGGGGVAPGLTLPSLGSPTVGDEDASAAFDVPAFLRRPEG